MDDLQIMASPTLKRWPIVRSRGTNRQQGRSPLDYFLDIGFDQNKSQISGGDNETIHRFMSELRDSEKNRLF